MFHQMTIIKTIGRENKMSELKVGKTKNILDPASVTFEERRKQIEEEKQLEKEEHQREKGSPYKRWVQMNKDAYQAEDWLMSKSLIAYRIFKFLVNNMDSYNAVMCSQTVLQETFHVSRVTVSRAVKLLKEKQYVHIYKSGTSNIYAVNKQIAWNSWGTNYRHGKFGATIILSESEQEENMKAKIQTTKHTEISIREENQNHLLSE